MADTTNALSQPCDNCGAGKGNPCAPSCIYGFVRTPDNLHELREGYVRLATCEPRPMRGHQHPFVASTDNNG